MNRLKNEISNYYAGIRCYFPDGDKTPEPIQQKSSEIIGAMDNFVASHPNCHPSLIKARLHEEIADRFEPVIFLNSPFFFEMGLRGAENWGVPYPLNHPVGAWMRNQRAALLEDGKPEKTLLYSFQLGNPESVTNLWSISGFDVDHHALGTTKLLRDGIDGLLVAIKERQASGGTAHEMANLEAMQRSARAVLRIARKFEQKAGELLKTENDKANCRFLKMIGEATAQIPARPPRTFYEGLAMLWFLREVTATIEGIGVSVIGHLDRQLNGLYRADLQSGRLTENEACDLLARWMMPTDVKFHVEDNPWPETSTCIELGGCDEGGKPVFNELTRLVIKVHREYGFINPKLNCRFSAQSDQAYLDLISSAILAGHNHFALQNDDILIPALVKSGKSKADARLYVNGGCQETITEGVEHSAGAYYYFNMARLLDLVLQPPVLQDDMPDEVTGNLPPVVRNVPDFESFYAQFIRALTKTIKLGADWATVIGKDQWQKHPCPFFSATLDGCIENGKDYSEGGAKYNPSGIALVGLGTIVDSLYAIKRIVFEERSMSLEELQRCLARNWAGYEALRARILNLPRFGHGHDKVDDLARRFASELAAFIKTIPNERGGNFQPSFFVYYAFSSMGEQTKATPDGRKNGDLLTQGVAPGREAPPKSLTAIFHSLARIDFTDYPGNAVLDLQLPIGNGIPAKVLSSLCRTFAQMGGPTIQFNCVSTDELRKAQINPENHRDLVVRISGLSAYFVCLDKKVQNEIINRAIISIS